MRPTVPANPSPRSVTMDRRRFLGVAAGAAVTLGLAACAKDGASAEATASSAPLNTAVPTGTKLRIANPQGLTQTQLTLAGLASSLPFTVSDWPNVAAGPDVINAFR